jgi:hypothetical protein
VDRPHFPHPLALISWRKTFFCFLPTNDHALVRIDGDTAYRCQANRYQDAIQHPEACIEVGFPLSDVRMSEAISA